MHNRIAFSLTAVGVMIVGSSVAPAGAQGVDPTGLDPVDDAIYNIVNCKPRAEAPTYDFGLPDITGRGSVSGCHGTVEIHVCLVYNGIPLPLCGVDQGDGSAEATATAPCLPGTWQTVTIRTGGPAAPSPIVVIAPGMCDPLAPPP